MRISRNMRWAVARKVRQRHSWRYPFPKRNRQSGQSSRSGSGSTSGLRKYTYKPKSSGVTVRFAILYLGLVIWAAVELVVMVADYLMGHR